MRWCIIINQDKFIFPLILVSLFLTTWSLEIQWKAKPKESARTAQYLQQSAQYLQQSPLAPYPSFVTESGAQIQVES